MMVKIWSMSQEQMTLDLDAICNRVIHAGLNASVEFNDEEEAYVLNIGAVCGDFQIAPGFLWSIDGEQRVLAHPDRLNTCRSDGTPVTWENATDEERIVLGYVTV